MRAKRKPKPWTEAHRREALRRTYEILARRALSDDKAYSSQTVRVDVGTEEAWRSCLTWVLRRGRPARIDREVRRVDRLARGEWVRVTTWRGESGEEHSDRAQALADKSHGCGALTRVTRIRRAQ